MNKQLSLFEAEYEQKIEIALIEEDKQFINCPKCDVQPVAKFAYKPQPGVSKHWFIECPVCKYSCATFYNRFEHWNTCNKYRVRDGRL